MHKNWTCTKLWSFRNWRLRLEILKNASLREPPKSSQPISIRKSLHASLEETRTAHNAAASHPWDWPPWAITALLVLLPLGNSSWLQTASASTGRVSNEGSHARLPFAQCLLCSTSLRLKFQDQRERPSGGEDVRLGSQVQFAPSIGKGELPAETNRLTGDLSSAFLTDRSSRERR